MNKKSIVIDREYGSGGREVARILSEKLGMEFYDGNLLVLAGKEYGIDLGTLQTYDEKGVGSLLHDLSLVRNSGFGSTVYGSTVNEAPFQVYSAQSRLVQQLVAKGPAIFLGRCTGQILKTEARVPFVHAFIYASNMQDRIDRARNVDGVEASRIEAYIKRRDNQRKNYNKFFTDKTWGDRDNYDLMLNTSALGYEGAAAAIMAVMGE
ncbi:MAG: cytidylate kinase-like family protein [Clostridia bacterium]|nr:cytidylate kinase-like family protein [Clostridia bacterium]MBQ3478571.1 cytidylate kinase-like family protein [Clostridia bacterium]MBQ6120551.1 cytidylate kinase-like family protein [Clostridia bacterium]MBQ6326640.1 cytidylate kinase-like family protein [Clostridia bacterium]